MHVPWLVYISHVHQTFRVVHQTFMVLLTIDDKKNSSQHSNGYAIFNLVILSIYLFIFSHLFCAP